MYNLHVVAIRFWVLGRAAWAVYIHTMQTPVQNLHAKLYESYMYRQALAHGNIHCVVEYWCRSNESGGRPQWWRLGQQRSGSQASPSIAVTGPMKESCDAPQCDRL